MQTGVDSEGLYSSCMGDDMVKINGSGNSDSRNRDVGDDTVGDEIVPTEKGFQGSRDVGS